jgi:hypothetical protein
VLNDYNGAIAPSTDRSPVTSLCGGYWAEFGLIVDGRSSTLSGQAHLPNADSRVSRGNGAPQYHWQGENDRLTQSEPAQEIDQRFARADLTSCPHPGAIRKNQRKAPR